MRTQAKFKEYIWLVNTINKARAISFADIQKKWLETDMSEGIELARSTFNRHKDAIEDIFGIYIECNRKKGYKYSIGNPEALESDSIQNWMLATLASNNIISECVSLQDRIVLETVPYEGENLKLILDAMKRNIKITILYKRYGNTDAKSYTIEPYCIKLHKQRWYVLGHFHYTEAETQEVKDYYALFSLDRIKSIESTDTKFEIAQDFNAQDYFKEYYGVLIGDGTAVERIRFRAYDYELYRVKDLPLHSTQKTIAKGDNYMDFEITMRPTVDFFGYLMSRGSQLRILSPEWLAEQIHDLHRDAMRMYEKIE